MVFLLYMYNVLFNKKLCILDKPVVAGIINVSPESFYKSVSSDDMLLSSVGNMIEQGAAIIDIGGCSTRPGGEWVSEQVEWERIEHALSLIVKSFPNAVLSIDTFRSGIAYKAVNDFGVAMVNDVCGGMADEQMFSVAGSLNTPYVLTHNEPLADTLSGDDLIARVIDYFQLRIYALKQYGVKDIILDPGFGFGKSVSQNYILLHRLNELKIFNLPILVGLSHKSMIYKVLNVDAVATDSATVVMETYALLNGANIVRTHNVKAAIEAVKLLDYIRINN